MNIGWPAAIVVVAIIFSVVTVYATRVAARGSLEMEEAKGRNGEQYKQLSADYEQLAKETRDLQAAMQTDIARLTTAVESMEQMMREVG